jgi:hypothetical protein
MAGIPIACDGLLEAFERAKGFMAEYGLPLVLVDGNTDPERAIATHKDGIFIVEIVRDGTFGPTLRERPPHCPRIRDQPPLGGFLLSEKASKGSINVAELIIKLLEM